jgi:3-phenylpropionate/trans-cinnamate dioxygenase ferredoxin subunit
MISDHEHWIAACSLERLAEKAMVCARIAGVDLIVMMDGERIFACERACPHEQADLSRGHVADGRLFCPRHLAWFNLLTGEISPGWPSRALRRYPVRIAEGQVWVCVDTALRAAPAVPRE